MTNSLYKFYLKVVEKKEKGMLSQATHNDFCAVILAKVATNYQNKKNRKKK